MTKHAAVALTHALRFAGWEDGIRTTNICPGLLATDMSLGVEHVAREHMSQPHDIAGIISHLLTLPNSASVVTVPVNCLLEASY